MLKKIFQIRRNFCKLFQNGKAVKALTQAAQEANGAVPWP
jgi:hypothetical protein